MREMMRSFLALLVLMLVVSQASGLPFSPSSDALVGLAARSALKERKPMVSQASDDLVSPSTSDAPAGASKEGEAVVPPATVSALTTQSPSSADASGLAAAKKKRLAQAPAASGPAGHAAGSASKEGEAVVPPASGFPVPSPCGAHASGPAAAETVSKKKREAVDEGEAPAPPAAVIGGPKEIRDRVVLIFANILSLMSSIFPFILRWGYGSWYITREIFPAKGVACGFIASGAWTVYVILEMYAENNYSGQEALMMNCLTMGINLVTLLIYFLHGGENKKFWVSPMVFMMMALGGLVWLVWHPNTIRSDTRKTTLKKDTQVFGVIGIVLFATMNIFPFADLWALTFGDRNSFFTLLVPIMMNTLLSSLANCLWTIYAWLFGSRKPNYFMYANIMATGMTFLQAIWLSVLRLKHKEVEGLITEVESLRSCLIGVFSSLTKLGGADGVWNKKKFLMKLEENLKTGGQSLLLIEVTLLRLQVEQHERTNAAEAAAAAADAAGANPGGIGNQEGPENAEAVLTCAKAARNQYPTLLKACGRCTDTLQAIERDVKAKLSDAQGGPEVAVLKQAALNASDALRQFAWSLRRCMQVINASQGIPPTLQYAFDHCREKMFIIKIGIDSELVFH